MKRRLSMLKLTRRKALLIVLAVSLLACGGNEVIEDESITDIVPIPPDKIPTVQFEELSREKVEHLWSMKIGDEVTWVVTADLAPNTDLAVRLLSGPFIDWVIIPKGKTRSKAFKRELFNKEIDIMPLPMISIVGKGLVVDKESLDLPKKSLGGHLIPEDFDCPLYMIGEKSQLTGEAGFIIAEFVSSIPPDNGVLRIQGNLILTFTRSPLNVTVNGKATDVKSNTATLAGPHAGIGEMQFTIGWDNGPGGKIGSHTMRLIIKPPD